MIPQVDCRSRASPDIVRRPFSLRSIYLITLLSNVFFLSCSTVYYNFWETFGQEKRDLLKSNITKMTEDQSEVQEEFKDTLEKVRTKYKFDGGSLESTYDALSDDYDDANSKAKDLSNRIDDVEEIADDLFEEWRVEAAQISNASYRRDSLLKRKKAMKRFGNMRIAMQAVEKSLRPVLTKLKDQVLYLKHNLNARSLGGFKSEFNKISTEISKLNADVKRSSRAADDFIKDMN